MHLYVGKTFTATASGSAMREVICEKCRCHFFYQLARAAKGTAEAPYYIGQDAAALRAQHRAQAKVDKMLKADSEVVPCPNCDFVQPHMLRNLRRRMYRTLRLLAWAIPLVPLLVIAIMAFAEYSSHPYRFEQNRDIYLSIAACCFGLLLLLMLLRYWLTRRITARGNEHLLAAAAQGAPPALLPQGAPDASGNQPLKTAPRSKIFASLSTDWVTFPLLRINLPSVCCQCLQPASTVYKSPMGNQQSISIPLCPACAKQIKKLAWKRLGLLSLACISAASLIALLPDKMELVGRAIMATAIACFSIIILAIAIPAILAKPFRVKILDQERGIIRLRFRNKNYSLLLQGLVNNLEGGPSS